jgi:hypothetical protein
MKKKSKKGAGKAARALGVGMLGVVAAVPGATCGVCLSFVDPEYDVEAEACLSPLIDTDDVDFDQTDIDVNLDVCLGPLPGEDTEAGVCLTIADVEDADPDDLDGPCFDAFPDVDTADADADADEPEASVCLSIAPDADAGDAETSDAETSDAEGSGDATDTDDGRDVIGPCLSPSFDGGGEKSDESADARFDGTSPAPATDRATARTAVRQELAARGVLPADVAARLAGRRRG